MRLLLLSIAILCLSVRAEAEAKLLSPKEFAERMQPNLPMKTAPGYVLTKIEAEGPTLVMVIKIDDPGSDRLSTARMASEAALGWCEMPLAEAYFKAGYSIRVDTESSKSGFQKGEVVRRCA